MVTPIGAGLGPADAIEATPPREHFPGLEVIRALAASMVVVHHVASVAGQGAGWMATPAAVMDSGVAVFFVLSGFLIFRPFAAALIDGRRPQRAVEFWWRRLLRIVPAYWVALSVLWAIGNFDLGRQWWRHYLFLQPFDRYTALAGLVPAWSLSTELCFYLLVPPLAWSLRRLTEGRSGGGITGRVRIVTAATVVVMASAPIARATADSWAGPNRALSFQWLPTNLDLFGAGMLLAVVSVWAAHRPDLRNRLDSLARPAGLWWAAAGGTFVIYAYRVGGVDFETGYVGWWWQRRQAVLLLASLALLMPAVFGPAEDGWLRALWRWRPLVWVGTVSYGLYLWHVGVLERLADRAPGLVSPDHRGWEGLLPQQMESSMVALLVATFGGALSVAALSWYLLERPLQRWRAALDRGRSRGHG